MNLRHNLLMTKPKKFEKFYMKTVVWIFQTFSSLLSTALGAEGVAVIPPLHNHMKRFSGLYTGPYFDPSSATNITTQLGTHAYLPCKVKQLGNKSVSVSQYSLHKTSSRLRHTLRKATLRKESPCVFTGISGMAILVPIVRWQLQYGILTF
jgi:hypothetical protein